MCIHILYIYIYIHVHLLLLSHRHVDPMDCTPPGSSVPAPLVPQARILEWVAMPSSRGIFPTQGSNPGLLHCRWILYQLSHKGSGRILQLFGSLSLLQGIFLTQESNRGFLHCRWILYQLSYQGSLN